jgi:hypothetical protein
MAQKKGKNKQGEVENTPGNLKKAKYNVSVLINGKLFKTETSDIVESILELKPEKITNKIIITVSQGDKKFEKMVFVQMAKRIFNNKLAADIFAKNAIKSLK